MTAAAFCRVRRSCRDYTSMTAAAASREDPTHAVQVPPQGASLEPPPKWTQGRSQKSTIGGRAIDLPFTDLVIIATFSILVN
jgi:hypothetical protein